MYLRVFDNRKNSRKITPYPSLSYFLTLTHRSIGYRNQNQSLTESTDRLMYLCVYDNRDSSRKFTPFPSLSYLLTHSHRSIGYHNQTQSLTQSDTRLMYLRGLLNSTSKCKWITTSLADVLWWSTQCVRDLDFLKILLFVLHNTDTVSFPLSRSRFLRYNKNPL